MEGPRLMREMTLEGFIAHLTGSIGALAAAEGHAMEQAAKVVEAHAKKIVGVYQTDTGQFPAWAELADATKDDRVRLGYSENEPGLRSGDMRNSIDHKAEHNEAVIGSDDQHMVYFELGTSKQPPRSVLGSAVVQTEHAITEILGSSVVRALVGEEVVDRYLLIPHSPP
jgi:hypothetical protein